LNLGAATEGENEQAGCDRIERSAMADLFDLKLSPDQRDYIVRRHPRGFVHE